MRKNFNVVVPTIKANYLLHNCVKKLELQTYKNFILTIVLEKKDGLFEFKNYLNKTNLSYNIIISTEKNISRKRNIGVNSSPSKYIAFIDSDAYPDPKWLEVGFKYLSQKKYLIIGGPSGIPYQNESEHFLISNYAKRSFFCNGNLAKRKYSKKN